jgi:prephenate dehydratase
MNERENTQKIAYQGEPGAYSEEAVITYYNTDVCPVAYADLELVFQKVAAKQVEGGLVPIENSYAGSINQTYDLLLDYELYIQGEFSLPIRHCLMALPGQAIADLEEIHSHPQALAQCRDFLRSLRAREIATYDTAGSALNIRKQSLLGVAAIASRRAAVLHELEIMAEDIQSSTHNSTRFVEIGVEPVRPGRAAKTSLVFTTNHEPGALHRCLGVLATRGINLTKLESRPDREVLWRYLFFVDFEGRVGTPRVDEALAELRDCTGYFKVLGSYPRGTENQNH